MVISRIRMDLRNLNLDDSGGVQPVLDWSIYFQLAKT